MYWFTFIGMVISVFGGVSFALCVSIGCTVYITRCLGIYAILFEYVVHRDEFRSWLESRAVADGGGSKSE